MHKNKIHTVISNVEQVYMMNVEQVLCSER